MIAEEIKYVACPFCNEGKNMHYACYGDDPVEVYTCCDECDGDGEIEESDYLILVLQHKV